MYQHVLIPTDGSDGTRRAIEHGIAIAEQFDATVHALTVLAEGPYGALEREDVRSEAEQRARRALEQIEQEADRADVAAESEIRTGDPYEEILDYATDEDVDMIVMGTAGRTGLDRVLVGSVTERVVRNAPVPVVTVRTTTSVRIEDPDEAAEIAIDAVADRGHDDPTLADDPHRTSGSWIVPVDVSSGTVHVHVDATNRDVRIATID